MQIKKIKFIITQPGILYFAKERELTKPFSYRVDKAKLTKLGTINQDDIPVKGQDMIIKNCSLFETGPEIFEPHCDISDLKRK